MSKTEETSSPKLSKEQLDLSSRLQKALKIGADGNIPATDQALYETLLPEGLTVDIVKRVQKHHQNLVVATADAVGALGTPFLDKHKKVDHVHLEKFNLVNDHLRIDLAREATVRAPGGKTTTYNNYLTGKLVSASAGASGAAFGRVRTHYATLAKAEAVAEAKAA